MRPISRRSRAVTAKKRTKKSAARAELLFCESNLSPFWSFRRRCCHNILGYVHSIPSSFSCRHEKLSGIVLTPIRYAVADPGEGPGGAPRYFSTKMRPKGPKKFSWRPPALISRSSWPPPHLKVWIRHWYVTLYLRDCHGAASLLFWNWAEITVLVCERKPYPVWFSRRRSWVIRYSVNMAANSLKADFHCRVTSTRVNKMEAMDGRSRVSMKVERGSAFTFTGGLSYISSILFTHVNFMCIRTKKLRDSGNQPLWLFQNEVHENCELQLGFFSFSYPIPADLTWLVLRQS